MPKYRYQIMILPTIVDDDSYKTFFKDLYVVGVIYVDEDIDQDMLHYIQAKNIKVVMLGGAAYDIPFCRYAAGNLLFCHNLTRSLCFCRLWRLPAKTSIYTRKAAKLAVLLRALSLLLSVPQFRQGRPDIRQPL